MADLALSQADLIQLKLAPGQLEAKIFEDLGSSHSSNFINFIALRQPRWLGSTMVGSSIGGLFLMYENE